MKVDKATRAKLDFWLKPDKIDPQLKGLKLRKIRQRNRQVNKASVRANLITRLHNKAYFPPLEKPDLGLGYPSIQRLFKEIDAKMQFLKSLGFN